MKDFASGHLGIVKTTFHRSVLIAAYRHIAGDGLNVTEQQVCVDVCKTEMLRRRYPNSEWTKKLSAQPD